MYPEMTNLKYVWTSLLLWRMCLSVVKLISGETAQSRMCHIENVY